MSDHDPLCPNSPANSPELKWCDCDFIHTVRADERQEAARRVLSLTVDKADFTSWNRLVHTCSTLARGEDL